MFFVLANSSIRTGPPEDGFILAESGWPQACPLNENRRLATLRNMCRCLGEIPQGSSSDLMIAYDSLKLMIWTYLKIFEQPAHWDVRRIAVYSEQMQAFMKPSAGCEMLWVRFPVLFMKLQPPSPRAGVPMRRWSSMFSFSFSIFDVVSMTWNCEHENQLHHATPNGDRTIAAKQGIGTTPCARWRNLPRTDELIGFVMSCGFSGICDR